MKKFIYGVMITFIGLLFFAFSFFYAVMNPGTYNNISGLYGSLLYSGLTVPFIISFIVLIIGIIICGVEAYRKK
ncbi:hypothetical protein [Anaerosporobacter faecicola]|uniref:hypothetical protein n=1 Tax=Anaerosporobacter faecicola TaxID=2718714 RepID=UPI00143B3B57|nr:hypothetical protein [Anaerosporobacter faecicola]